MIDTSKLRGIIAERNTSQRKVARALGMSDKTFYTKMKKGIFDSNEIEAMIRELKIKDPMAIFFAEEVA